MAFPVIAAAGDTYNASGDATSHPLDLPAGVVAGSLLLGVMSANVSSMQTTSWPSGWAKIVNDVPNSAILAVAYKFVQAGDAELTNPTITVTTAESLRAAGAIWRVSGHHATTPPEASTTSSGTSTSPDPPSLSPTEGGTEDRLWVAVYAADGTSTAAASYPTNYPDNQVTQQSGTTSGTACGFGAATRALAAATENPGAFTIGASRAWGAAAIAVRPAGVGGGTDLTVADATHVHTADSPAITQVHQLAVADATHVHTADVVTLNTATNLVVADATHAHIADSPDLAQVGEPVSWSLSMAQIIDLNGVHRRKAEVIE